MEKETSSGSICFLVCVTPAQLPSFQLQKQQGFDFVLLLRTISCALLRLIFVSGGSLLSRNLPSVGTQTQRRLHGDCLTLNRPHVDCILTRQDRRSTGSGNVPDSDNDSQRCCDEGQMSRQSIMQARQSMIMRKTNVVCKELREQPWRSMRDLKSGFQSRLNCPWTVPAV